MRHNIPLLLVCVTLIGCGAAIGNPQVRWAIEENQLPKAGNTQEQIRAWIGTPNQVTIKNGQTEWGYVYSVAAWRYPGLMFIPIVGLFFIQMDTGVWRLFLTFDERGRVVEIRSVEQIGGTGMVVTR